MGYTALDSLVLTSGITTTRRVEDPRAADLRVTPPLRCYGSATRCPGMVLRRPYAVSGTDVACAATRRSRC
eukprot:3362682-Rhodomonas_salina.2